MGGRPVNKYINCTNCGKLVRITGYAQKFCRECAAERKTKEEDRRRKDIRKSQRKDIAREPKKKKTKKKVTVTKKDNICKRENCKYHDDGRTLRGTCNYLSMVGHSRGCPVQGCTEYKPGKRKRKHGDPLSVMEG